MSVNKSLGSNNFWRTTNVSVSVKIHCQKKNVKKLLKEKKKPGVVLNYEMQQLKRRSRVRFN